MKIKNILVSLVAILALAAGCNQVEPDHYLSEVKVSSSYVAINMDGGSTSISVEATESWTIPSMPQWLTISPMSGGAGVTNVTFSAAKTLDGRTAEIVINCGGKTQNINVIQGLATVSKATCAEVIAGPESKTYLVTGVCTGIANTSYGNWYLNDGTGEIYIYGTVNAAGNYAWSSFNIEVGDEVTVQGPKTVYNGTVELVDATFISVNKSLIKVAEVDPEDATFKKEGSDMKVTLSNKGTGLYIDIPESAKSWLSISSIAGNVVTLTAAANEGGDRDAKLVFKTKQGGKDYTAEMVVYQKGAIIECSVADFIAAAVSNTQYRVTGVITEVANASYGNIYIKDYSGEVYVYGIGAKGDFEKLGLKVGDIVTLVGKRGEYKGTPQMTGAKYESHIPVATKTVAELRALNDDKNTWFMVTGVVTKPDEPNTKWDIETYGNLNLTDATGSIYVYGVSTGVNGKTKQFGTLNVKEGDLLTIIGYRTSYTKNEYTLLQMGGAMYVSHVPAD